MDGCVLDRGSVRLCMVHCPVVGEKEQGRMVQLSSKISGILPNVNLVARKLKEENKVASRPSSADAHDADLKLNDTQQLSKSFISKCESIDTHVPRVFLLHDWRRGKLLPLLQGEMENRSRIVEPY